LEKHVTLSTQQLGNQNFCGSFAQFGVDDFVWQLTETCQLKTQHYPVLLASALFRQWWTDRSSDVMTYFAISIIRLGPVNIPLTGYLGLLVVRTSALSMQLTSTNVFADLEPPTGDMIALT